MNSPQRHGYPLRPPSPTLDPWSLPSHILGRSPLHAHRCPRARKAVNQKVGGDRTGITDDGHLNLGGITDDGKHQCLHKDPIRWNAPPVCKGGALMSHQAHFHRCARGGGPTAAGTTGVGAETAHRV